jgi:hypothetical protein
MEFKKRRAVHPLPAPSPSWMARARKVEKDSPARLIYIPLIVTQPGGVSGLNPLGDPPTQKHTHICSVPIQTSTSTEREHT